MMILLLMIGVKERVYEVMKKNTKQKRRENGKGAYKTLLIDEFALCEN